MKTKILLVALALAMLLAAAGAALANGNIELPRWVISGGATNSTSGDISLNATLGQPLVGIVSGGDITLGQGFWYGDSPPEIFLPLIMK